MDVKKYFGALVTVVVLAACGQSETTGSTEKPAEQATVNRTSGDLPGMKIQNVKGEIIDLADLKGKKVFVNLWAAWCPPCRKEMPSIQSLFQSVDTSKVAFVMLALDDDFQKSRQLATSMDLTLPLYYPAAKLPPLFNVEGIPATFIFDEKGVLIKRVVGSDDYNTEVYKSILQ